MKNWELVDYVEPFEEEHEFPRVTVRSESELRRELDELRQRRPGAYQLDAPDGESLSISIGGRFAALQWVKPPAAKNCLTAVTRKVCADAPVVFTDQGMPEPCEPKYLFPVEEIIEAVVYFYKTHRLPEWMDWYYWNDDAEKWETKRGTSTPPSPAAPSQLGQDPPTVERVNRRRQDAFATLLCPRCQGILPQGIDRRSQPSCPWCRVTLLFED